MVKYYHPNLVVTQPANKNAVKDPEDER